MRPVDETESYSTYEKLSRRVGFYTKDSVSIPSVDVAKHLLNLVKLDNNLEAAEAVMKIVRFAPSAKNKEEREAKKICCEASDLAREGFGG